MLLNILPIRIFKVKVMLMKNILFYVPVFCVMCCFGGKDCNSVWASCTLKLYSADNMSTLFWGMTLCSRIDIYHYFRGTLVYGFTWKFLMKCDILIIIKQHTTTTSITDASFWHSIPLKYLDNFVGKVQEIWHTKQNLFMHNPVVCFKPSFYRS
jgi:hypothetical protein